MSRSVRTPEGRAQGPTCKCHRSPRGNTPRCASAAGNRKPPGLRAAARIRGLQHGAPRAPRAGAGTPRTPAAAGHSAGGAGRGPGARASHRRRRSGGPGPRSARNTRVVFPPCRWGCAQAGLPSFPHHSTTAGVATGASRPRLAPVFCRGTPGQGGHFGAANILGPSRSVEQHLAVKRHEGPIHAATRTNRGEIVLSKISLRPGGH